MHSGDTPLRPDPGEILFQKPAREDLSGPGLLAADLHVHTNHSDAPTRVRDALKFAARQGIGLAITDHNQISGALEACRAGTGVPVIPGIEVSADDGPHLLLYFAATADLEDFHTRHIERKKRDGPFIAIRMTTEEILDAREGYHSVAVEAHPCGYALLNRGIQRGRDSTGTFSRLDAIEVISGGMARTHNLKAAALARRHGLGQTGGTDAHLLRDIGGVVTCARAGTVEEFLGAIVHRETAVVGQETSVLRKAAMGAAVLPRHLPYALPILQDRGEHLLTIALSCLKH
ncbi:PHP-associated domain-containing protein [Methanofollis sp. UBA420]|jgi:predicted metal-dependent phosphoesterase TrpH|uniref:PHP-associated domain-containing protein n=1 Tax=Methanofollis sp. UBA420 TaxID=1915514 RepID=UPI00316ACE4E